MKIVFMPNSALKPADWRTTYLLKPDFNLLRESMMDYGWAQPIVVQEKTSTIIDGFHRWAIAQEDKFIKVHGDQVPVYFKDIDDIDSMIMHIRLNRARGSILAKKMSDIIIDICVTGKYDTEELLTLLGLTDDELDLMLAPNLIKHRKVPEHKYSRAWIPIEAPKIDEKNVPKFERPPNLDR
jgi:ParB-like chromosome segregation protein Spo0J